MTTNTIPASDDRNLIDRVRQARPGADRIIALNEGPITERVLRLAALSVAEEVEARGYTFVDSRGPCVLAVKLIRDASGRKIKAVWLASGPTGDHTIHVQTHERENPGAESRGPWLTERVRVHWRGYLEVNRVRVEPVHCHFCDSSAYTTTDGGAHCGRCDRFLD